MAYLELIGFFAATLLALFVVARIALLIAKTLIFHFHIIAQINLVDKTIGRFNKAKAFFYYLNHLDRLNNVIYLN